MTDIFRPLTDEEKHGHRLVGGSCLDAHRKPPMHFTPVPVSLEHSAAIPHPRTYKQAPVTGFYCYDDGDGLTGFATFRYDPPNARKQFGWLTYGKLEGEDLPRWHFRAPPPPRMLYNLPDLLGKAGAPVLVVEGEKTANKAALAESWQGYAVTTSSGGAEGAHKSDWSPLAGREVLIAPDNDIAGQAYAHAVAELARQAGALTVQIIRWPDYFPKGWDIADALPVPEEKQVTGRAA